jgi:succinate dehydrogenase flavin-adding protein (antitoxin of CptAB toxin-antitoxin module)
MRYLEQGYPGALGPERFAFEALLELEDLVLARYLFGTQVPACQIQQGVIKKIAAFQNE